MTLAELIGDLERRRAEAERVHATAPLAVVYGDLLDELHQLDGGFSPPSGWFNTTEAAGLLRMKPKTVASWCGQGRFPSAYKTAGEKGGQWRIPAEDVYRLMGKPANKAIAVRLWTPDS